MTSDAGQLGLVMKSLDQHTRNQLGLKVDQGAEISSVVSVVAAQAGLKANDVILMVNQHKVHGVEDFNRVTRRIRKGDTVLLLVRRGNQTSFISLSIPSENPTE